MGLGSGGIEMVVGAIRKTSTSGITASTTQTQGQQPLTSQVNEVSTVANNDDTVTLPASVAGEEVTVINNGAKTLQIFPASGDDLGGGVNAAGELEPNEAITFVAYDATNWHVESSTEVAHAEMFDVNNSDAYVINDAGADEQVYHTNGMAAGDLAGWTFDAGGAGTSFPIVSVGNAGSGDILVTTTGSHGLAVGDIVSQSNLSNSAYVGIFVVKTVPLVTTYTVTAAFTATGTGTMDQAATLKANVGSAGQYLLNWAVSATAASNNDIFQFFAYVQVTKVASSQINRKFGIAADIGAMSGVAIITVGDSEQVSFVFANTVGAGNITLKDFNLVLIRL